MNDIIFLKYFGNAEDFELMKKWFKVNSEIYKDLLVAAKERYELENDYSIKLNKIGAKILKSFSQTKGSCGISWSQSGHMIVKEAEVHKQYSDELYELFYKPLLSISEAFNKHKKPIESEIDRSYKLYLEKNDEEIRSKKKAFNATKDSEKAHDAILEYAKTHPTSIPGNDKDRSKIERTAYQKKEASIKAETEYFESAMNAEEARHKWEQTYLKGLEQLQKVETERLLTMKKILESYQQCLNKLPEVYTEISNSIVGFCNSIDINEDLKENSTLYTSKATAYQTEQVLMEYYAESKDNDMDKNRRIECLSKRISVIHQSQKNYNELRMGTLKMIKVYEENPTFADDNTKKKTRREYSRTQSFVNYLNANIYKLNIALHEFNGQPTPSNPLTEYGMKMETRTKNNMIHTFLISNPGIIMSLYDPGNIDAMISPTIAPIVQSSKPMAPAPAIAAKPNKTTIGNVLDDVDVFDSDSDDEFESVSSKNNQKQTVYFNSQNSSGHGSISSGSKLSQNNSIKRPLPSIPMNKSAGRCRAIHNFNGRDTDELTFQQGDIMNIIERLDNVWWNCELRGNRGLIPVSYVEEI